MSDEAGGETAVDDFGFSWLAEFCPRLQITGLRRPEAHAVREIADMARTLGQPADAQRLAEAAGRLLQATGARAPEWTRALRGHALPAVGVSPVRGCFLVRGRDPGGAWLVQDAHGAAVLPALPDDALFGEIAPAGRGDAGVSAFALVLEVLRGHRALLRPAGTASALIGFLALATALYSMQVYDRVIPTEGVATLMTLTVGVLIAIGLDLAAKFARAAIVEHAVKSMDTELSHRIFERLLRVRMDQLPPSVGTLSAQLRSYEQIRAFAASVSLYALVDLPFAFLFLAVILWIAGPAVATVPLVFFGVALGVGLRQRKRVEAHARAGMAASNRKLGLLVETVEGAEAIKSAGAAWQFQARWNALTRESVEEDTHTRHLGETAQFYAAFLQQLSYVLLIATGAYLAATSTSLTMGGLIACSILSGRVLQPTAMLPGLLVQWAHARSALAMIEQMFRLRRDNDGVEQPLALPNLRGGFQLENVVFAYPGMPRTLAVPDLRIGPGEKVGVIGAVGSGKSTLLRLLSGMYAPQEGRVLVDGLEMQQVDRASLVRGIGYLPQDVRLFGGTLRDNLLHGLVDVTDEQLVRACEATGLAAVAAPHPKGLELPIAEGGGGLSGGQRQIAGLTRLLLARPRVWLLDELTASMDDVAENRALVAIKAGVAREHTLVLVTHKTALLELVDRLIVLAPAGVVLDGPRDAVLQRLRHGLVRVVPREAVGASGAT